MTKEQFFTWHANNGGKNHYGVYRGKLEYIKYKDWLKLKAGIRVELPCGAVYTIPEDKKGS